MRIGALFALALALVLPMVADAQVELPSVPNLVPCPVPLIPCGSGGSAGLRAYLDGNILPATQTLFVATAVLMFLQYGMKLLFDPDSADTVSTTKVAYGYGIVACAIVGVSSFIVAAVGSENARVDLINDAPVYGAINNIVYYMRLVVATLVTIFLLIQGVRLIVKQGSEDEFNNAKTQFTHTIMGIAVILLANILVEAFLPGEGSRILAPEIVGIINFALTIIGGLAVVAIIVAGFMLVLSIDENLKDRAKKTIMVALVGLIIAILSYIIVRFFVQVGFNAV